MGRRSKGWGSEDQTRRALVLARSTRYGAPEFADELKKAADAIDGLPESAGREEIEKLVKSMRPDDAFLTGPQSIVLRMSLGEKQ